MAGRFAHSLPCPRCLRRSKSRRCRASGVSVLVDESAWVLMVVAGRKLPSRQRSQVYHDPARWAELNRRGTLVGLPGNLDGLRREGGPAMFPS